MRSGDKKERIASQILDNFLNFLKNQHNIFLQETKQAKSNLNFRPKTSFILHSPVSNIFTSQSTDRQKIQPTKFSHKMLKTHVKTKNKFNKKKPGKFNKNKPKDGKPKVKKSEQEDEEITRLQESYEKLPEIREIKSFDNLPLSKKTRKGLLANKFRVPTEIQKQSLGLALLGKDVLGAAQTGSGKTLGKLETHIRSENFNCFSF